MKTRLALELFINKLLLKLNTIQTKNYYEILKSDGVIQANKYFWQQIHHDKSIDLKTIVNQTTKELSIIKVKRANPLNSESTTKNDENSLLYALSISPLLNSMMILEILNKLILLLPDNNLEELDSNLTGLSELDQVEYLKKYIKSKAGLSWNELCLISEHSVKSDISDLTVSSLKVTIKSI